MIKNIEEVIKKIELGLPFFINDRELPFSLYVDEFVPYVGVSIHSGHSLRKDLSDNCLLNEIERSWEEDPKTDEMISSLPIRLIANDSRYEYDINRSESSAIYDIAWGKKVWRKDLDEKQKKKSLEKYYYFYKITFALINKLQEMHGKVTLFDIHSYNYERIVDRLKPMFDVGTEMVAVKYRKEIDFWINTLKNLKSETLQIDVGENVNFPGNENFLKEISNRFENCLVIFVETKKCYWDEITGEVNKKALLEIKKIYAKAFEIYQKSF